MERFYIFHSVSENKFLLLFLVIQYIQELLVSMEICTGNTFSSCTHHFISYCGNYLDKSIKTTVMCYMAHFLWTRYSYRKYNDTFINSKNYEN